MEITLNQNEIYSALSNMIISQEIFGLELKGDLFKFVDRARVDGSLYGDTKEYISTNIIHSKEWLGDAESESLLKNHRVANPDVQLIKLDVFRQAAITTDEYLTKRAFLGATEFSDFNSKINEQLTQCKSVYDATNYNAYIGTAKSDVQGDYEIDVASAVGEATGEEKNRLSAQAIAEGMANLIDAISDLSVDYNDYGKYRSVAKEDLVIVWNKKAINKITKIDVPTIFNKDGLFDGFSDSLYDRFFGDVNSHAAAGNGSTIRSLIEQDIVGTDGKTYSLFAGDLVPTVCTAPENTSYTVNDKIIAKVMHRNSVPYMSAFAVGTEFYNPKSLSSNKYLTWGHNTLTYIKDYPFVEVKVK